MTIFDYWGSVQGLTVGNIFSLIPSYRLGPLFLVLSMLATVVFLFTARVRPAACRGDTLQSLNPASGGMKDVRSRQSPPLAGSRPTAGKTAGSNSHGKLRSATLRAHLTSKKNAGSCSSFWTLGLPTLFFLSTYVMTYSIIDEVSINLEHSYNLFHYGKFSMSPDRMVDGTVELFYYLAHVPWASSHSLLILGNFLIGFMVGWLHLWLLWRFWFNSKTMRDVLALCLFGLNLSLIETLSSGFGNGLLSLAFLASLSAYHRGRPRGYLTGMALLPLIRPDGILVSLAGFFLIWMDPKNQFPKKIKPMLVSLLASLAALGMYFIIFRVMYGHFIPTPLYLKSVSPALRVLFDVRSFVFHLGYWIAQPWTLIFLLLIAYQILRRKLFLDSASIYKTLFIYLILLIPTFLYVEISNNMISVLRMDLTYSRYWGALLLVIYMMGALTARDFRLSKSQVLNPRRPFFLIFLLVLYTAFALYKFKQIEERHAGGYINRNYAAMAGSFADRIAPSELTFATAEMNTFGLASERFVIDLFGYATPEIAKSQRFNFEGMRCNPDFFHEIKPDVVWLYWFSLQYLFANFGDPYNFVEEGLKVHACGYYQGDYRKTFQEYDFFFIRDTTQNFQAGYLVRKTAVNRFAEALQQHGFKLERERRPQDNFYKDFGCPYPVALR